MAPRGGENDPRASNRDEESGHLHSRKEDLLDAPLSSGRGRGKVRRDDRSRSRSRERSRSSRGGGGGDDSYHRARGARRERDGDRGRWDQGHRRGSYGRSREGGAAFLPDQGGSEHTERRWDGRDGRYHDEPPQRGNDRCGGGGGGGFDRYGPSSSSSYGPPSGGRNNNGPPPPRLPRYEIRTDLPRDPKLGSTEDDPRGTDPTKRITTKANRRGAGRNTESFDPASTLVRPDLRVLVGSNRVDAFNKPLKHDDVVIVPELFGAEDDWTLYYKLVEEMREVQSSSTDDPNDPSKKGSEWISWHEGAHLITKNPKGSKTFEMVVGRLCAYFNIKKESIGTRFNWYRDSNDWKPFHHDSAAFNPQRARNQNITVGVSFGATRELAFVRAHPLHPNPTPDHTNHKSADDKVRLYFPQTNNGVFSFGRDANILWKHGVNALKPDEQDGKGRISIILWGLARDVIEEEDSPDLLGSD